VKENVLKLSCHIDNEGNPINNLSDGLDISFNGEMEKWSDVLERNALFKKTMKVNKLPSYLCIQFVRFYWKKESNVGGTKAGRAKILRSVMYPKVFDLYNHCTDELKKSLDLGREFEQKIREEEDNAKLAGKLA
jgi:ubiquitin carboxyl-terminal hydrolase 14